MIAARRSLFGLPIDALSESAVLEIVQTAIEGRETIFQASLNAAKVVQARKDPTLRKALARFDLVTADGQAIVWAARLLGCPVPGRVAGIDLMHAVVARCAHRGWRVYLLGGTPEVVDRTRIELRRLNPGLRLAGHRDGYFAPGREEQIVREIRETKADVLFVALGSPEKELFLDRNRNQLGVSFAMGVGGAFDVVAGVRSRAPRVLQRLGLEWAFRLAQEPRRLGRRYLSTNTRFVGLVCRELVRR